MHLCRHAGAAPYPYLPGRLVYLQDAWWCCSVVRVELQQRMQLRRMHQHHLPFCLHECGMSVRGNCTHLPVTQTSQHTPKLNQMFCLLLCCLPHIQSMRVLAPPLWALPA